MKKQLPNRCSVSELSVSPNDWHTKKAKVTINWFIKYRFYDPKHPSPKQVMIKGMNSFKSLKERQDETKRLIALEVDLLHNGYNPYDKTVTELIVPTTLIEALELAHSKLSVAPITHRDVRSAISKFKTAISDLGWNNLEVSIVSRKHFREILDRSSKSNDRFNKLRSYLMMLVSVLCEMEIIQTNFIRDIKKRKTTKYLRKVLSEQERVIVNNYLEENYPSFHRFLHIFYHSGARISELIRLKVSDIDLPNQRYKIIIKKGTRYYETWKSIKNIAMPFWEEQMNGAYIGQFVFSKGLEPGDIEIDPSQINKRWYRTVKKTLGITADFYSLKHLHTSEVVELLNDKPTRQMVESHFGAAVASKDCFAELSVVFARLAARS